MRPPARPDPVAAHASARPPANTLLPCTRPLQQQMQMAPQMMPYGAQPVMMMPMQPAAWIPPQPLPGEFRPQGMMPMQPAAWIPPQPIPGE